MNLTSGNWQGIRLEKAERQLAYGKSAVDFRWRLSAESRVMMAVAIVREKERRALVHRRKIFKIRLFPDKIRVILMKSFYKRIAFGMIKR